MDPVNNAVCSVEVLSIVICTAGRHVSNRKMTKHWWIGVPCILKRNATVGQAYLSLDVSSPYRLGAT